MAKTLLMKTTPTFSHHHHYFHHLSIILYSPPNVKTSCFPQVMAMCSSFYPPLPINFRNKARPVFAFPTKPQSFVSFKAFSSQADTSTTKDDIPARIGFLGLGIMGSPMAQNLLKAGTEAASLTLAMLQKNHLKIKELDDRPACDAMLLSGIGPRANVIHFSQLVLTIPWTRCLLKPKSCEGHANGYKASPEEVAASCDITFAMLADPESAMNVACGKHGAASGMGPEKGYVDVSTVDGDTSKLICQHIKATGAQFLEAPVSGSKKPAEDGQLIFLTAGDRSLYEVVGPLLDIMGKSRFYLGDVGNGAAMKLVVNMIMGSMMASFSEGLLLSEKVGLDPSVLVEVISQGAISAPMYSTKGPSMAKSLYPTAFPLKHQQKDLRLALGLAESVSQSTPIAAAANELYKVAKSHGLSDDDFSAVIEALKVRIQDKK